MIIKHLPSSDDGSTDTDKLPDIDALIIEKAEELRKLCFNAKRQCLIIADAKGLENGACFSFFNLQMKEGDMIKNIEDHQRFATNLIKMIDCFLSDLTKGTWRVAYIVRKPEDGEIPGGGTK